METHYRHFRIKLLTFTVVSALTVGYGVIGPVLHAMVEPVITNSGTYAVAAPADNNQWIFTADVSLPVNGIVSDQVASLELQ